MTIANDLYKTVDVDSSAGVYQQVANFCALIEGDIEEFTSTSVDFYDGSGVSYDDYSIAVAG
jgi:hypothetical protein